MRSQINDHCSNYNLQPDYQWVYREGYYYEMVLLQVSNDILWSFERQHIMSFTALHLSARFDTVDHSILIKTLSDKYGMCDTAFQWFKRYLQSRSFKALINKNYSREVDLTHGVPQGSAAGANCFNLYCSTLQKVVPSDLQLSGFADDHSIQRKFNTNNHSDELHVKDKIEQGMLSIKSWMDGVILKMNPSKSKFI